MAAVEKITVTVEVKVPRIIVLPVHEADDVATLLIRMANDSFDAGAINIDQLRRVTALTDKLRGGE